MFEIIRSWLIGINVSEELAVYISYTVLSVSIIILSFIVNYIAKRFLLAVISVVIKKSKTEWDDILLKRKVFSRLSHLAPALVFYFSAYLFGEFEFVIQRFSQVYIMLAGLLVIFSFLDALIDIYKTFKIAKQHPVKGYVQVIKIVLLIFVSIIAVATVIDKSPLIFLSGIGALTAVIMLVFKDTILGLVASVQLTTNNMIHVGDWIEMPKYGADGDVIDISLHTIKVQNWDKTITTIPAYALISDSFKNWRGMSESGGRRIKRSIYFDMSTIKFCTSEMLERFGKFQLLNEYINTKQTEIAKYNQENKIDSAFLINGRNLTNIGTFRAYILAYLKNNPKIHKGLTFIIRQLAPIDNGLPIEIYVFSNDQNWINYEGIQSDIMDHLLAVVPMFDLRVFQNPTGYDFQRSFK